MIMMRKKLKECFERLQGLDILPTEHNLGILLQTLYDLRAVWNELGERENNERGTETDPE